MPPMLLRAHRGCVSVSPLLPLLPHRSPPPRRLLVQSTRRNSQGQPPNPRSHLTPVEEANKANEQKTAKPPPYLTRPLGVKQKSVAGRHEKQSLSEWKAELLNREKRIEERKHLVKEVTKGYFHDYNQIRHLGTKLWAAPRTLIKSDLALYFPDIEGTSLATKQKVHTSDLFPNKVSVVVLGSVQSAEEHINSFVRPVLSDLQEHPDFQYVYINAQENPLKSFLVSMFISSLRKSIPKWQQSTYLLSSQSLEYLHEPLGMSNKHIGYVYLVDSDGKIRWAGCGWASPREEEDLRKCTWVLVDRLKEQRGTIATSE